MPKFPLRPTRVREGRPHPLGATWDGLGVNFALFSAHATKSVFDADLRRGDYLVFGKETAGLPEPLLTRFADRCLRFPMVPGERGLNLATAVCAAAYEGVRQMTARGELCIRDGIIHA